MAEPALLGLILALAAVGALDALYFVLVTYRVVPPDAAWLPRVCRIDEATCARIVDTPEARALGPPNAVLGLAFYLLVAAAAAAGLLTGTLPGCALLLAAALGATALSAYLAWALLARLRARCVLCFLGHGLNAALLVALALACL